MQHFAVVSHAWLRLLLQDLRRVVHQLKEIRMSAVTQQQIYEVATNLTSVDTTINSLNTTAGEIATEVAAPQEANPGLDLSGLTAATSKLGTDAATLSTSVNAIQATLAPSGSTTTT